MKSPLNYVKHINSELNFLTNSSLNLTQDEFLFDEIKKRAFVRSFAIIGEATKDIPHDFKDKYPNVEWKKLAGLRDKLIHGYFEIDYEIVWDIIVNKLPDLKMSIAIILNELN